MAQSKRELVSLTSNLHLFDRLEDAARQLESASPQQILEWAFAQFADGLTIATGFGAEGMALIDIAATINPQVDVFFLDTDFLFPETYALRRRLEERYQIEIRAFKGELSPAAQEEVHGANLWSRDPDLCCRLRKLEPLKVALQGRRAWGTAIRRDQTAARANAKVVEWDSRWNLVKVNPLARWSKRDVWQHIFTHGVPYNPLHNEGYLSIGCTPCTRPVTADEDERAGRWAGFTKTECGLHA
jgi:phosphoadenosine phosphosulfate reductase